MRGRRREDSEGENAYEYGYDWDAAAHHISTQKSVSAPGVAAAGTNIQGPRHHFELVTRPMT